MTPRCVDCHYLIHGVAYWVWGFFYGTSTHPAAITGPIHHTHLSRYGRDRVWGWTV